MASPEFDEKLWFTIGGCCPGRHYLLYSAHTFIGRIAAWCPTKQILFYISKVEIKEASLEAQYWLRGFLAGCEPNAAKNEEGDYLPEDDPVYERWRQAIKQFPETGIWILGERECERCHSPLLPTQPGYLCPSCVENANRE